jgi:hypothetical protein
MQIVTQVMVCIFFVLGALVLTLQML